MNEATERLLRNPDAIERLRKAHEDIDLGVWVALVLNAADEV